MRTITITEDRLRTLESRLAIHGKQIAEMQQRIDALEIKVKYVQENLVNAPHAEIFVKESNTLKADDHE